MLTQKEENLLLPEAPGGGWGPIGEEKDEKPRPKLKIRFLYDLDEKKKKKKKKKRKKPGPKKGSKKEEIGAILGLMVA